MVDGKKEPFKCYVISLIPRSNVLIKGGQNGFGKKHFTLPSNGGCSADRVDLVVPPRSRENVLTHDVTLTEEDHE